ncbi:hypothetical protein PDE_07277 [Penicillium oxalicum 114-2]|uniref:Uncharacterized protein n=1 Tax=Penicillium oxalicum (strain 114-2 / CGMCC 5302) TaxID=933388 RepID=S8BBS0_PENO1|nr:hypothetical protein PDE_07277 [Penicillium oxalicum 114-2]
MNDCPYTVCTLLQKSNHLIWHPSLPPQSLERELVVQAQALPGSFFAICAWTPTQSKSLYNADGLEDPSFSKDPANHPGVGTSNNWLYTLYQCECASQKSTIGARPGANETDLYGSSKIDAVNTADTQVKNV